MTPKTSKKVTKKHRPYLKLDGFARWLIGVLNNYYSTIQSGIEEGRSNVPPDVIPLYPNMVLVTETNTHFVAEISGATRSFRNLDYVLHKETSLTRYLSRFYDYAPDPMLTIAASGCVLKGVPIVDHADFQMLSNRFPSVTGLEDRYRLARLERKQGGGLLRIESDVDVTILIDCLLLHRHNETYSFRNPKCLIILLKTSEPEALEPKIKETFDATKEFVAMSFATEPVAESHVLAGQLQNLILIPGLRETTLGRFLKDHASILLSAFSATDIVYEPYCKWIHSSSDKGEKAINPDLFLKRADGYWDVYDLKTPLLTEKDLTRGPSRRRRFIAYVYEGIAQMAHYRHYLSFVENREYLQERYGVTFKEPRFQLVVGFFENTVSDHIAEAGRAINGIDIIDYDSLIQLYLAATHMGS